MVDILAIPSVLPKLTAFLGLAIIILTGSELCTGSFMYTTMAFVHRRLSLVKMLLHWTITFLGNLAGSLFVAAIITGCEPAPSRML
jgi:formate/nitrite transporter FocA (FNT family)